MGLHWHVLALYACDVRFGGAIKTNNGKSTVSLNSAPWSIKGHRVSKAPAASAWCRHVWLEQRALFNYAHVWILHKNELMLTHTLFCWADFKLITQALEHMTSACLHCMSRLVGTHCTCNKSVRKKDILLLLLSSAQAKSALHLCPPFPCPPQHSWVPV